MRNEYEAEMREWEVDFQGRRPLRGRRGGAGGFYKVAQCRALCRDSGTTALRQQAWLPPLPLRRSF
jgi:hypothetical protein